MNSLKSSSTEWLEAAGFRREPGCCGNLNWRVDVPRDTFAADRIATRLAKRGYHTACCQPFLVVARSRDGHEIAFVPTTGRAQLRVYWLHEEAGRPRVAHRLAADLLAACHELPTGA